MKSYFAKLAVRATLANVPAPSAVYTAEVSDPFEVTSPPQSPLPPSESSNDSRSAHEPGGFALSPPSQETRLDSTRPVVETHKRALPETPTSSATLLPNFPAHISSSDRAVDDSAEAVLQADSARVALLTPIQVSESSLRQSNTTSADEATKRSATETASTEERLADLEQEQSVLLRKADAFMGQLLNRRKQSPPAPEVKTVGELPSTLKPNLQPQPANRAQPIRSAPRPSGQDSDRPSLVIGKLTVEVIPPTPAPVAPQPQVVVVRGARSRGNGPPSGRRFGLGQF
jgi:hypothetical protein